MKVSVDISPEYKEPYAVIHTARVTDEIQRIIDVLGTSETPITALQNEEDIVVLQSFSRESSQPRDRTQVSCIAVRFFTV